MNVIKTIRNNWKKTVFFIGVSAFGLHYGNKKYNESLVLQAYCLEAKKYGDVIVKNTDLPRKVTVFLNPAASRGKGKSLYEKNVAPLLNLAGLEVTLVKTEYEGQAKKYMEVLDKTDAIIVAGGDGTLSEVVTGLLRRKDEAEFSRIPVGVIPLGQTNTLAKSLCPQTTSDIVFMAEMTMSTIKGLTKLADIVQIMSEDEKTVYSILGLEWGAFTDAELRKKKYWYYGPLKHRIAYVLATAFHWPAVSTAMLSYTLPCDGCNRCVTPPTKPQWRWWHVLLPPRYEVPKDYSGVENPECGQVHTEPISATQFSAATSNCRRGNCDNNSQQPQAVTLTLTDGEMTKSDFIQEGWNRLRHVRGAVKQREIAVREFYLVPPDVQPDEEGWYLIDNERYEVMGISCRLLPKKLRIFFSDSFTIPLQADSQRLADKPVLQTAL